MTAQVERDDVEAIGQPLRKLFEVTPVAGDAVQADECRQALVAPLVAGEAQVVAVDERAGDELVRDVCRRR